MMLGRNVLEEFKNNFPLNTIFSLLFVPDTFLYLLFFYGEAGEICMMRIPLKTCVYRRVFYLRFSYSFFLSFLTLFFSPALSLFSPFSYVMNLTSFSFTYSASHFLSSSAKLFFQVHFQLLSNLSHLSFIYFTIEKN